MKTADQIASQLSPHIAANNASIGVTNLRRVLLGDGQGNVIPEAPITPRDVLYRSASDQNDRGVAILSQSCPIPLQAIYGYNNTEVWIGNIPGTTHKIITDVADIAGFGTNGPSPMEGLINAAAFPDLSRIALLRLRPSSGGGISVYVDAGPYAVGYEQTSGGLGYFNSQDFGFSDPTDSVIFNPTASALTSGQHRIIGIALDPATGNLFAIPGTAVSASGTLPSRSEFDVTDYQAISFTGYYPAGFVYSYYGQTDVVEDDCLRIYDPRVLDNVIGGLSGSVFGPGSSTDRAIASWNGTAGTALRNNANATIDASGNLKANSFVEPSSTLLSIASNAVTITQGYHKIESSSGTTDTLKTISGGVAGQTLVIQADSDDTITVQTGTGNIFLNSGSDFSLSGHKALVLFYDGSNWSDIGAGGSSLTSPLTTKGDLWGYDTGNNRVPIGSNNALLVADSSQALGLKWSATLAGLTLTSPVINTGVSGTAISDDTTFASPSSTTIPTTNAVKSYVDAVAQGLSPKDSVVVATTSALPSNTYSNGASGVGATLTGIATGVLTVDGHNVALNERVLVKDEAAGSHTGIYLCTVAGAIGVAYVLTRATDNDTSAKILGSFVFVEQGTTNGSSGWVNTNASTITIGTTAITWTQFSGAGEISVTAPLSKSGNTISLTTPLATNYGGTNADLSASGSATAFLAQNASHVISARSLVNADIPSTLSSKTLDDTNTITVKDGSFTLENTTTPTKKAVFDLSSITAATTRTWTFPDVTDTFVGRTATQTLTNKTLNTPAIGDFTNANHNHTNAAGGGQLSLTAAVTNVLPEANGGTNRTNGAATKALDNLASTAVNADILPSGDNARALGSSTLRYSNVWAVNDFQDSTSFPVKNTSGSTASANDVGYVVYDATNGWVYTTTTTANLNGVKWCVVISGGANNATIYIATQGKVTVALNANCSIGNFLTTSTTAGQAAVNTLMRPEVFAIALTANSGGAGGTCTAQLITNVAYVPATNTNDLYSALNISTSNFVSTISGAPSTTSVVYGTVTAGDANDLVPNGTLLLNLRLWNTTRNSFRLITAVNTGTKTITTVASTDSWANGDAITLQSQTVVTGQTWKAFDLDFSQQTTVPTMARAVSFDLYAFDTALTNAPFILAHPFETYGSGKVQPAYVQAASIYMIRGCTIGIISGVIDIAAVASGTHTGQWFLRMSGYWLAVP